MKKESIKIFATTLFFLTVLLPMSFLFLIFAVVALDLCFGISPPFAFVLAAFLTAIFYGVFIRIGYGFKRRVRTSVNNSPKRLLRVQFLQDREQI